MPLADLKRIGCFAICVKQRAKRRGKMIGIFFISDSLTTIKQCEPYFSIFYKMVDAFFSAVIMRQGHASDVPDARCREWSWKQKNNPQHSNCRGTFFVSRKILLEGHYPGRRICFNLMVKYCPLRSTLCKLGLNHIVIRPLELLLP